MPRPGERAEPARVPLRAAALSARLVRPGGLWREIRVASETGSTNADLLAEAARGAAEGLVLVAEAQTAARGRLGRAWTSPPRAALTFSVLLRPGAGTAPVPSALLGWVPLLTGVAVASALVATAGIDARLKWPNDVLAGGGKLAGILAEARGGAIVVGVGLNVSLSRAELPVPGATSLLLAGAAVTEREPLLAAILGELARWYSAWRRPSGGPPGDPAASGLGEEYRARCATLGRAVRVLLPAGAELEGTASGVDQAGRLVVSSAGGPVAVSAGDIVHLR